MTRWEYQLVEPDGQNDRAFCEMGQEGWELVGFDKDGNAWFKKPAFKREDD